MKYIMSLSGGVASAVACDRAIQRYGGDQVVAWFADTSWEDADLHRFLGDCLVRWGADFITYRDGRTPLEVAEDHHVVPNQKMAPCSFELKIEPFTKFIKAHAKPVTVLIGLDWSEIDRHAAPKRNYEAIDGVSVDFPLMWKPYEMRNYFDVVRYEWGIEPPRLYAEGFPHNNCFAGETRFLTTAGIVSLSETAGQTVDVLTTGGNWKEATIQSFGVQPLMKLSVQRGDERREIFTTADHRWIAYASERGRRRIDQVTSALKPGARLVSMRGSRMQNVRPSAFGIAHGVVYGDGTRNTAENSFAFVMLVGDKNKELAQYFPLSPKTEVSGVGIKVSDLPRYFKELPDIHEAKSYLYGWLAGYFAADGTVAMDGYCRISSARLEALRFVEQVCLKLGISTNPIHVEERVGLGTEPTKLYTLAFVRHTLRADFFLIAEHRARADAAGMEEPSQRAPAWTVVSVEPTDRVEEVFCAVVPDTHEFVLEGNILTGNCGGRCVRQGVKEWRRLKLHHPERFAEVRDWEAAQRAKGDARANYAIARDQRGGDVRPLTLAEIEADDQSVSGGPVQEDMFSCFCSV